MGFLGKMMSGKVKLLICIVIDVLDFTVGRILLGGIVMDVFQVIIAVLLFGPMGLIALWELADPSEQIDGFVPTLTLLALSQMGRQKKARDEGHPPPEL